MGLPLEWGDHSQLRVPPSPKPLQTHVMRMNFRTLPFARLTLTILAVALSACSSSPTKSLDNSKLLGLLTPYRVEVVQGNVLTTELVARVKPGMARAQVRDLLGSPLLTDLFHDNRWDYVFTIRRPGAESQQSMVVARFDGDKLISLDVPPNLPNEKDFVASINTRKARDDKPKLELSEAERKALPIPPKLEVAAAEAVGAVRVYPPLEAPL